MSDSDRGAHLRTRFSALVLGGAALTFFMGSAGTGLADGQACLEQLEAEIARQHRVGSIEPQQLVDLLKAGEATLLIDARDGREVRVSSIPGSFRVDPDMSKEAFLRLFGSSLAGRKVIIYCTVGVRSSRLAERIGDIARNAGAKDVRNLSGGILAWHNYGYALADGQGYTAFVHPYGRSWKQYLDFPEYSRFRPVL